MMRLLAVILALAAAAPAAAQQTPPDPARVYELAEVEVLPRPQNAADLLAALHQGYPPHLRQAGVGGTVHVAFVVDPDGHTGDVRVLSTPDSGFNAPTVEAVSLLRFTPAQVQGHPVAVRVEQPITWRVEPAAAAGDEPAEAIAADERELSGVEELPVPLNIRDLQRAMDQEYPRESAPARATVQLRFRLELDGTVSDPRVTHSTDPGFNEPALRVIQVLRFSPARVNGEPVKVWVEMPIEWSPPASLRASGDLLAGAGNVRPVYTGEGDCAGGCEMNEVEEPPRILNEREFQRALRQEHPHVDSHPGVQAVVQVRFRIEEDGTITSPSVTRTNDVRFNAPTLSALRSLRFRPAKVGGRPVKVWVEWPISWGIVMGIPGWDDTENGATRSRARRPGSPSYTTPSPR
ncbi:MAG TPA: TonB family protein [Longimicrobium sp.]|nr:TonB family protein [Longimicrobium sp.]